MIWGNSACRILRRHVPYGMFRAPKTGGGDVRVYEGDAIRNVAVVGHGSSGKTSLVDAAAFVSGSSKRHGSVDQGNALTDYTPD